MHWLSDETLQLVRKKRRAYKLAKCTGKPHHLKLYRTISNKVRNLTRKDHVTANMDKDQRPFWRWLKNARAGADPGGVDWVASHSPSYLKILYVLVFCHNNTFMFTFPYHHPLLITENQMCMRK